MFPTNPSMYHISKDRFENLASNEKMFPVSKVFYINEQFKNLKWILPFQIKIVQQIQTYIFFIL